MNYKAAWFMEYNPVNISVTVAFRTGLTVEKNFSTEDEANSFLAANIGNKTWVSYLQAYINLEAMTAYRAFILRDRREARIRGL